MYGQKESYLLCGDLGSDECDKVQKIRKSGDVCGKSDQSDSRSGIHAFIGNRYADTVWNGKRRSFQTAHVGDHQHRSVYGCSWNGGLYHHSDDDTDQKMQTGRNVRVINILVVEDDIKLNQIVCTYLNDSGFHAKGCLNANDAYEEMYNHLFELIISDIMMPEIDGFEFAETVRRVNKHIPILFMSAKDDLPSKQKGFQLGIDDYMVKPIELDELLLRVRALLRRANIEMDRKLVVGNLELDADAMTAKISGEEIPATTREFNILYKLLSYPNKTFSRAQLMDEFWGVDSATSLRAVDVYITKLRDKFSDCDGFEIKTVRGLGYKAVLV